jgi:plastocyanin
MRRATMTLILTTLTAGLLWLGAGSALAGGGCAHGTPPTDGSGTTVTMEANCFTPTVLHAPAGAEVTFTNADQVAHTVTGVGFLWGDTIDRLPGDEVTLRFEQDGVYVYSCLLHPGMIGAVVVGDASGDAGLDPAAVAAAPADSTGTGGDAATFDAAGGTAWPSIALAVVAGMAIGLLGFLALRRSRDRRGVATSG